MNIIDAEQHLGASWSWKSLTQGKYLLVLVQLKLVQSCGAQRHISPVAHQSSDSFQQISCEARHNQRNYKSVGHYLRSENALAGHRML